MLREVNPKVDVGCGPTCSTPITTPTATTISFKATTRAPGIMSKGDWDYDLVLPARASACPSSPVSASAVGALITTPTRWTTRALARRAREDPTPRALLHTWQNKYKLLADFGQLRFQIII